MSDNKQEDMQQETRQQDAQRQDAQQQDVQQQNMQQDLQQQNVQQQDMRQEDLGLRQGGPDSLSGFVADDGAGDSSIGAGQAGNSQSGINSNFAKASPESNVGPAGAEQSSHGNASGAIPGGVLGTSEAGQNSQSAIGGAATGGAPGTHRDRAAQDYVGRGSDDKISERLADGAESSGSPGDLPA